MNVFVVYCHPSHESFTYNVMRNFLKGLDDAGHTYVISDLYAMNFNPVFSENEYLREAFYRTDLDIPDDIKKEHEKIMKSDAIVFIYPVFWTDAPALLGGWFQRVWTYGFAYGPSPEIKVFDKALFFATIGGDLKEEIRQKQVEAMKTIMIGDRMNNRAASCEMIVFDEMTRGYGNDDRRRVNTDKFLKEAYDKGYNI